MHNAILYQNYPMTLIHILYNLMQVYLHIRDKSSLHSIWLLNHNRFFFKSYNMIICLLWYGQNCSIQRRLETNCWTESWNQAVKKMQDFTTNLKSKTLICVKLTWSLAHYVLQRGHCQWRGAIGWEAAWKRLNKSFSLTETKKRAKPENSKCSIQ